MIEKQIVELIFKDGSKYKVFLNGTTEGLPDGTIVVNHALPLFHYLFALANRCLSGKESCPILLVADEQT
jgi:hypothetical protein